MIELSFRDSGQSIFVDRREDTEDGESAGDGKLQQSNCEMAPRTNPIPRLATATSGQSMTWAHLRPEPKILDSGAITEGSI